MKGIFADKEIRTLRRMIRIFCRKHHAPGQDLCADCREMLDYGSLRIRRCPFGGGKPVCSRCSVHCYDPAHRERIREIMRFAGPRMLLRHPGDALLHLYRLREKKRPDEPGA